MLCQYCGQCTVYRPCPSGTTNAVLLGGLLASGEGEFLRTLVMGLIP